MRLQRRVERAFERRDLRVRPRPGAGQIRQLVARHRRAIDRQHRQRTAGVDRERHALLPAHDDQAHPGTQAVLGVRRRRREQPRKIGTIEIDAGQKIGFERARRRRRVGANHLTLVDADDIARPEQRHRALDRRVVDAELHRQRDACSELSARRVGRQRGTRPALPEPRIEEDPLAHAATSDEATISMPLSRGFAATCSRSACAAAV